MDHYHYTCTKDHTRVEIVTAVPDNIIGLSDTKGCMIIINKVINKAATDMGPKMKWGLIKAGYTDQEDLETFI